MSRLLDARPLTSSGPAAARIHRVMLVVAPIALGLHVTIASAGTLLGAWPLVWFNLGFSLPLWIVTWALLRRGRFRVPMVLAQLEVLSHAVAATLILGWDSGFHAYALIPFATVGVVGQGPERRLAMAISAAGITVWTALFTVTRGAAPLVTLAPSTLALVNYSNIASTGAVLATIIFGLTRVADAAELALEKEHARSERLLENMLPTEIARRLKDGEQVIADGVEDASVLFADIVGFTGLSARTRPAQLVETLNAIFTRVDALAERYGLEKIKTIGDAYMVASGVPKHRADHATALAGFALELVEAVDAFVAPGGARLQMRVGLNSGPVVAGVIGTKKLAYDLWGDTVNTAARMESHGVAGKVHVSAAARERLVAEFVLEPRGVIDVKGKGPMETWLLVGRRGG